MVDEKTVVNTELEEVAGIESIPEIRRNWNSVTRLGKLVQEGKINDLEEIFNKGYTILEPGIVDALMPDLQEDLLLVGQAKGKFGGGQRRVFRQTQKKTKEGNKIQFVVCASVGNKDGYVGMGTGKSKETVPAREKAKKRARLNLIRIRRGCGSWQCGCGEPHSIPFTIEGRCGSARIKLIPAPKGKGLCVEKEAAKILALAGIKDVWSKTKGQTGTKLNFVFAVIDALKNLSVVKVNPDDVKHLGIIEGKLKATSETEMVVSHE